MRRQREAAILSKLREQSRKSRVEKRSEELSNTVKRENMTKALKRLTEDDRWWIWLQNVLTLASLVIAPTTKGKPYAVQIVLGVFLSVAGAVIGILGVRHLGRNRSPHPQPLPGSNLVRSGIFSLIRHPLYSSLILLTFGWAIWWNSVAAFLTAATLAMLLDQKARLEERYLNAQFPQYGDYAARVRRFLPGIY